MKLSCGNDSFPLLAHEIGVGLIAQLGFDGYDLSLAGTRSPVRLAAVLSDVPSWAGRLDERVRGRGLEFSDVFYVASDDFETMSVNHPDAAEREAGRGQFRRILDLVVRLGCPGVTTLPGLDWPGEDHETSLARAGKELASLVQEAAERGVLVSVEPHVGSVCRSPADIERLCELARGLTLTLDYTHYVCQGFTEAELDPLLVHTRHFHARGGTVSRLQAPLKDNTIDWGRIVERLESQGYKGYTAVEYCSTDWEHLNELDVISETVLMRDFLRAKLAGTVVPSYGPTTPHRGSQPAAAL